MKRLAILATVAAAAPMAAEANAGVGFLMLSVPVLGRGLLPIILVEAPFLARTLQIRFARASWVSLVANLGSTILGAVIAIGVDFALLVPSGGSGLPPSKAGYLVSLVPMFFVTWWIEVRVVRSMQPGNTEARRATLFANLASYALLAVAVAALAPTRVPDEIRARITNALSQMGAEKVAVQDHFDAKKAFPPPAQITPVTKELQTLAREAEGRLVGTLSFPNFAGLDGKRIILQPRVADGRIAEWVCSSPDAPPKYLPASCRQPAPSRSP